MHVQRRRWDLLLCQFGISNDLDGGYLRYIDYDLDLKLYPDKLIKPLDEQEFLTNAKLYGYTSDLIAAVRKTFRNTRKLWKKENSPSMIKKSSSFITNMKEKLFLSCLKPIWVVNALTSKRTNWGL